MPQPIREVLNRRTDLSTFVVHLTRDDDWLDDEPLTAREKLDRIIAERKLLAKRPMGWATDQHDPTDPDKQSQRVVCFSETSLEHIYSLVADIEDRQTKFKPYGVALTKMVARRRGINPILYVDMTPHRTWKMAKAFDTLRDDAIWTGDFHEHPFARVAPFLEPMGDWRSTGRGRKEFWWERENGATKATSGCPVR